MQRRLFNCGKRLDRLEGEARKLAGEQREFAISRAKMLRSWRTHHAPVSSELPVSFNHKSNDILPASCWARSPLSKTPSFTPFSMHV